MNATWKGKITLSTSYKEEPTANLNGLKVPVVENGDGLYAVSHDVSEISSDWNKTEYRYAGSNPNNYATFNNEIWRIIGLVNVKNGANVEQRIKIVRTDGVKEQKDFGDYYWDTDTNNWTTSKLKDMLNGIYYESGIGDCYSNNWESQCDFGPCTELSKGLDLNARNMVDKEVIWNLGGWENSQITTNQFYEKERGASTGSSNTNPSEWTKENDVGEKHNGIGLMYPSDYGYAVGNNVRNTCLTKNLIKYNNDNCYLNDWLLSSNDDSWTLSPNSSNSYSSFSVISSGFVQYFSAYTSRKVWPTLYLKSSVKITPNPHPEQEYGTVDNPFQLSVQ